MTDRCKKSCCWTPYTCARHHSCKCHAEPSPRADVTLTPAEVREAFSRSEAKRISEFAPWR